MTLGVQRSIGRLLTLTVIALLAALIRALEPVPGGTSATMMLGFLLLAAFVAGELARNVRLPRITGYLVIGLLFGPDVLGLLPEGAVADFRLINHIALSLIALQAGGELRLVRLRERFRSIATITASQIVITMLGIVSVVYLGRALLPFLSGQTDRSLLAAALIFGLVAAAKSPATTIAVITELRARGPLTDTVLGVSVLKDVLILLMIALVIPAAVVLANPSRGFDPALLREIGVAILVSLLIGAVIGLLILTYLRRVGRRQTLFLLAVAFLAVELAHALGLKSESYILMGIAAGFVVQNLSARGPEFLEALEANSLPLYALFFAIAGADLDLKVIPSVWQIGALVIVARALFIYLSTYLGAAVSNDSPTIRHYAWMGFLAKAGVTLGLANIVSDRFAVWGPKVAAIIIAMVAVNQLIGPPLFRLALVRAKEIHGGRVLQLGGLPASR